MDVLEQLAVVSRVEPTARAVLHKARADLVEAATHEELRAWDQNDVVVTGPNGTAPTVSPHRTPLDRRAPALARRARRLSLLVVVAAALVAVGLVARPSHVEHPKAVQHPKLGAAAELRLIATNASAQSIPSVSGGRLLFTQTQMSILAHVSGGASSTVTAQATVGLTVKRWSNATGQSCTSITADPAQFPSPAVHSTWTGLGLRDGPATQPVTGCSDENSGGGGIGAVAPDAITGNGGVIDVSHLPVSPSSLAEDLQLTTTGIPALDHLSQGADPEHRLRASGSHPDRTHDGSEFRIQLSALPGAVASSRRHGPGECDDPQRGTRSGVLERGHHDHRRPSHGDAVGGAQYRGLGVDHDAGERIPGAGTAPDPKLRRHHPVDRPSGCPRLGRDRFAAIGRASRDLRHRQGRGHAK